MHEYYMGRAIELAKKGAGYTSPNPIVGAVIVKDDRIIGEGYHMAYGENHAEINAFLNASEDVEGATMYVTLEPCSHYGKTPPCAEAIVKRKIKKVVIGLMDPNALVAGRGIKILKENGIEVITGVMEEECKKINEIFLKYIVTKQPYCILKTAMTLDGKIATRTGHSKWITNELSRKYVHTLRHRVASIMVGIGTIIADDPLLTTRLENSEGKDPIRIIIDSEARIPLNAKVINNSAPSSTIIATTDRADDEKLKILEDKGVQIIKTPKRNNRVDLAYLIKELGRRQIDSVLIEGGSELNFSAIEEGIVDKIYTFIAPKIIGGSSAKTPVGGLGKTSMEEAITLSNITIHQFDQDIMLEGYIKREV